MISNAFNVEPTPLSYLRLRKATDGEEESARAPDNRWERARGAARTPIVVLSANATSEHIRMGQEAGADFHLAKPVAADELVTAVLKATEHGGQEAESKIT